MKNQITPLTKVEYYTINGKTFRTIAPCDPSEVNVRAFMLANYNLSGITGWTFKPTVKRSYKGVCNYTVKP